MKILTVDIGTGTQDIFLFDSRLSIENGFKLVLPSPTMMVYRRIQEATRQHRAILLTGSQMGGGPSAWAAQAHVRLGLPAYATPQAAQTLDDDIARVTAMGVRLLSEDEARRFPSEVERIQMGDFDFSAIADVFARFGVSLLNLDAAAVAVFDHGAAPAGTSDRRFRFDYLDSRIRERRALSAFAFHRDHIPPSMSRLLAVERDASQLACPVMLMDTAPAAVLGATLDPIVARRRQTLIVNVGNFHVLAFRLDGTQITGVFEHHTGEIDLPKLETYLLALADGSLRNEDVFNDSGHGALVYGTEPLTLGIGDFDIVVTGPRRGIYRSSTPTRLRPYFAVPFGDMMLAGCFGLLAAMADVLPETADVLRPALQGSSPSVSPWDANG